MGERNVVPLPDNITHFLSPSRGTYFRGYVSYLSSSLHFLTLSPNGICTFRETFQWKSSVVSPCFLTLQNVMFQVAFWLFSLHDSEFPLSKRPKCHSITSAHDVTRKTGSFTQMLYCISPFKVWSCSCRKRLNNMPWITLRSTSQCFTSRGVHPCGRVLYYWHKKFSYSIFSMQVQYHFLKYVVID